MRLAVFASGNGSNFEAVAQSIQKGEVDGELALLVCDQPGAFVLTRAEKLGVPAVTFTPKTFESKADYEREVLAHLEEAKVDLIVLAGYMRIVGKTLLKAYPERIINIHPSLLPSYPGRQGIVDAFMDKVEQTGVTVHLVDEGVDTGPVLAQETVAIEPDDTIDSLERKIHAVEHELFPKVIQKVIKKLQKEHV
ncbi:phosphoribosylglycinamide formyltransferase [Alkalibacterium sp.]|nr:MAG: phosphoribosylglycinamide formyltransferase [Alkalibacterium sp.]